MSTYSTRDSRKHDQAAAAIELERILGAQKETGPDKGPEGHNVGVGETIPGELGQQACGLPIESSNA